MKHWDTASVSDAGDHFIPAAAAFGGSSAFAWMSQMLQTKWFSEVSHKLVTIERNWIWIIAALVFAIFHIFVLGPGVEL
ncbi:MAG TPA: hypothetical protein VFQ23_09835 [Anaerolineales bacterium]|nr:hypothetical protein [Anaerolineales bacterium]